jgi:medium-chain acyl-[acyl-carrier-protein] hydrolase
MNASDPAQSFGRMDAAAGGISEEFVLEGAVSYWNVDRDNLLTLRSLFAFLQEAAIRHADQCGAGARAKASRGESWVLHRMAVSVGRYPRYEEALRVNSWSTGIRSFKGYREFRVHCGGEPVASASSVWLYLNIASKGICRVPREVADGFPTHPGAVFCPGLEKLRFEPASGAAMERDVSVRYSDFDGNGHVNNTAYLDYLQTALAAGGFPPRPGAIQVEFLKEITPEVGHVRVSLERRGQDVAFSLGSAAGVFARGLASSPGSPG